MQNNITELTQRLLRALDSNYNVIDMVTVLQVITLLEKVSITKELLETTRLGKHINDLRRNTSNESLAKRAKELVKKWRSKVLAPTPAAPDTNGQTTIIMPEKRLARERLDPNNAKRARINGTNEYDFSDNSNSSFKDTPTLPPATNKNVILINSDSNSSLPDVKNEPVLEEQQPKKRGRKKGSKNHRSLLDEAESSFTNKMAVSRGNAKVKTTQELLQSLQNRSAIPPATTSPAKNLEDWNERAAKLTERVSFIDQKLNASASRSNKKKKQHEHRQNRVLESGSVTNLKLESTRPDSPDDDEIVVVDDEREDSPLAESEPIETSFVPSLSIEEALGRLPPIDTSCLHSSDDHTCVCILNDCPDAEDLEDRFNFSENPDCPARIYFEHHNRLKDVTEQRVAGLHTECLDSVNGNFGIDITADVNREATNDEDGFIDIVPNFYELSPKQVDRDSVCENYKKYSISDRTDSGEVEPTENEVKFREYHQVLDRPSYNGDVLRILPYVVID